MSEQEQPLQPILAMMTYRGGARLTRCLKSIAESEQHFKRIILSVTAEEDSDDMHQCLKFQRDFLPRAEVICTGRELPTMQHQAFWVSYLEKSGTQPSDWIFWLSYDDALFHSGISDLVATSRTWPLMEKTMYLGPWAMRHEEADALWSGDVHKPLEVWTCLPTDGSSGQPVAAWTSEQLQQPTYVQMSGSVTQFSSYLQLRDEYPIKRGPMRIEAAMVNDRSTQRVDQLPAPAVIIYGRPNSDRASYGKSARREDVDLLLRVLKRMWSHPREAFDWFRAIPGLIRAAARTPQTNEEWRVQGLVQP